jgi:nicotinamidase/pyrazinamidase
MKKALIIVDLQNDFVSGSLPVPEAAEIIPIVNKLQDRFSVVVATRDNHPPNHCSFKQWPAHCVQYTEGVKFPKEFELTRRAVIVSKGTNVDTDSYGAFFDDKGNQATYLHKILTLENVTEVYVCGLATDYCVKTTAMQAAKLGYKTYVILDACRGVNFDTSTKAAVEMMAAGVSIVNSRDI